MRFFKTSSGILYETGVIYPSPSNLNYYWNFGVYSLVCLVVQVVTGLFLAMHYVPDQSLAFESVEHIMRNVNYGWLIRYIHSNGASFFFVVVYLHTLRGLYYGSYIYPREHLWQVGVVILLLMILTAFLGYVLPWGQMSFWAATVITNLVSAIPGIGQSIVTWIWGGYSVDNATLNRFFSLHFFFPFIILGLVGVHLALLHQYKSNNPLGIDSSRDSIPFFPYYVAKDFYGVVLFFMVFSIFLYVVPNLLSHTDNYISANPMVTPSHIVPEWYFLPFYAILRAIPDKLFGVVALLFAIFSLFILPNLLNSELRSSKFRPIYRLLFWFFLVDCLILGWIGSCAVEAPYVMIGQVATFFYFLYFFFLLPTTVWLEREFWKGMEGEFWVWFDETDEYWYSLFFYATTREEYRFIIRAWWEREKYFFKVMRFNFKVKLYYYQLLFNYRLNYWRRRLFRRIWVRRLYCRVQKRVIKYFCELYRYFRVLFRK